MEMFVLFIQFSDTGGTPSVIFEVDEITDLTPLCSEKIGLLWKKNISKIGLQAIYNTEGLLNLPFVLKNLITRKL